MTVAIRTQAQQIARELAEEKFSIRAAHFDQKRAYCWRNIRDMTAHGLMGMSIPVEYGGKGASAYEIALIIEELARHCTLTARVFTEANIGAITTIMHYGSELQKLACAPLVLAGDKPALCIKEPNAGSDETHMQTTARRCGSHYVLNGTKHQVTGGGISKIHLVFARILDEENREEGIGAFIIIRDLGNGLNPTGLSITNTDDTPGLCGMPEATLSFDNVTVDTTMRLDASSDTKDGFGNLISAHNGQRVGSGTVALGVAAGALEEVKRCIRKRHQSGQPSAEFQGLQRIIADMDIAVHASRLILHEVAQSAGPFGIFPDQPMAARAKLFASESALKVVNQALQIFDTRGYGLQEKIERMYRDVHTLTIGGGTAEILRNQIAGNVLDMKTHQTCNGHIEERASKTFIKAAE